MKIETFQGGYDKNFSYLIWCEKTKTAAIIDPAVNPTSIIENIESKNLNVTKVYCAKIIEFFNEELEELQEKIAEKHGYKVIRHVHQLFVKPIK